MANHWVRLNLLIALSKSLNTNLLAVFDNLDKNINFNRVDDDLVLKVITNQTFFKKNILSYLTFDLKNNSDSSFDFNSNSDENDFKSAFQNKNNIL